MQNDLSSACTSQISEETPPGRRSNLADPPGDTSRELSMKATMAGSGRSIALASGIHPIHPRKANRTLTYLACRPRKEISFYAGRRSLAQPTGETPDLVGRRTQKAMAAQAGWQRLACSLTGPVRSASGCPKRAVGLASKWRSWRCSIGWAHPARNPRLTVRPWEPAFAGPYPRWAEFERDHRSRRRRLDSA